MALVSWSQPRVLAGQALRGALRRGVQRPFEMKSYSRVVAAGLNAASLMLRSLHASASCFVEPSYRLELILAHVPILPCSKSAFSIRGVIIADAIVLF